MDSLASALEEQLGYGRDSDSLTTSPSTSSLDTCSSHRIYHVLGKSGEGSPGPQEKGAPGEVKGAGERSATCYPETEAGGAEESKIPRSVTDGELKQRILNPLCQHGVSSGQLPSLPPWRKSQSGIMRIFLVSFCLTESLQLRRI